MKLLLDRYEENESYFQTENHEEVFTPHYGGQEIMLVRSISWNII
jgi:hypothetical protein